MLVWSVCFKLAYLGEVALTLAWSSSSKSSMASCRHGIFLFIFKYTSVRVHTRSQRSYICFCVCEKKAYVIIHVSICTCTVVRGNFLRSGLWHAEWEGKEESKQGKKCVNAGCPVVFLFMCHPLRCTYNIYLWHFFAWSVRSLFCF